MGEDEEDGLEDVIDVVQLLMEQESSTNQPSGKLIEG